MPSRNATDSFLEDARAAAVRFGVEPPKTLVLRKRKHPSSELAKLAQALIDSIEQCHQAIVDRAPQYMYRSAGMSAQDKDQSDLSIGQTISSIHHVVQKLDAATTDTADTSDQMKHHQGQVHVARSAARAAVDLYRQQKDYRKQQDDLFKRPNVTSLVLPQELSETAAPAEHTEEGSQEHLLEEENAALLREMTCLNSQVEDVQRRLIEIGELSSLFRTEIIEQAATIDSIHELTEVATHNMSQGNENLEQATKDGFGARLMMVVFLLVASACILFLDWYQ